MSAEPSLATSSPLPAGDVLPPLVDVSGVAKRFGPSRALEDASLEIRPGEVHTVMGENGSGKSTLVKILAGVHRPDRGSITLRGHDHTWFSSPIQAQRVGIATVFQEVLTVPGRTVRDNIWLGGPKVEKSRRRGSGEAARLMSELVGKEVDLDSSVDDLSLSERQAVCIVRALVREPEILILDESTASLDVATRDRLFDMVRRHTASGMGALFISHRMDEIFAISDVITVLRNGSTVASRIATLSTSVSELVGLMTETGEAPTARAERPAGDVVLSARGVVLRPGADAIDLDVRAGELVGLAGLEGQGQVDFLEALWGNNTVPGRVVRLEEGRDVQISTSRMARRYGIGMVPRERRREGLFEQLSTRENFGLGRLRADRLGPLLSWRRTDARLRRYGGRLNIKVASTAAPISTLSGGNQQKVLVARILADDPRVLLLNDPTRGIDPHAKHDLYEVLLDLCEQGIAVVMISSEVDELVELADRVVVFRGGGVGAELAKGDVTRSAIIAAYFGTDVESVEALLIDEEVAG